MLYSNVLGIKILQIFTTLTTIGLLFLDYTMQWWVLSIFIYFLTGCLGITITYHRYLSHKSFKMPKILEYTFSILGALGGTGSTIGWLAIHNAHHKYSDLDKDPHSPHTLGLRLFLTSYNYKFNLLDSKSLLRDNFHIFLHKYYNLILLGWATLLLVMDYRYFLFMFVVPVCFQIWASNISNYANHMYGYKNFDTNEGSKNTWWVSAITWGEGWHNNHHAEPWTYTFQRKWWEIDVSAYIIYFITLCTGNKKSLQNCKY